MHTVGPAAGIVPFSFDFFFQTSGNNNERRGFPAMHFSADLPLFNHNENYITPRRIVKN